MGKNQPGVGSCLWVYISKKSVYRSLFSYAPVYGVLMYELVGKGPFGSILQIFR